MGHEYVLGDVINVTGQDRNPDGVRSYLITRYRRRTREPVKPVVSIEEMCRYDSILVGLGHKGNRIQIRGAIPATSDMYGGSHTLSIRTGNRDNRHCLCAALVLLNSSYANAWLDVQQLTKRNTTAIISSTPFYPCAELIDMTKIEFVCDRLCRYVLSKCTPLRFTQYMHLLDAFVDGLSYDRPVGRSKYVAKTLIGLAGAHDAVFYGCVTSLLCGKDVDLKKGLDT